MTNLTARQREILSKIRQTAMLTGAVAIQQATDDGATMALRIYDDIGLDSLEVVELGMEIEEAFGIDDIPDDAIDALKTVADCVALIERMAG